MASYINFSNWFSFCVVRTLVVGCLDAFGWGVFGIFSARVRCWA
jgi:hypothetical protein